MKVESYFAETQRLAGEEYRTTVGALRGIAISCGLDTLLAHGHGNRAAIEGSTLVTQVVNIASGLLDTDLDPAEIQARLREHPDKPGAQGQHLQEAVVASTKLLRALREKTSIQDPFWQQEVVCAAMEEVLDGFPHSR